MAYATCRSCKRGANESTCPHCGGAMVCDEIFEPEEGGAYPTLEPRTRDRKKPSIFAEYAIEERREQAISAYEEKHGRKPKALDLAIIHIEAQFGKGSVNVGRS
jgi:hypothetical protein